MGNYRYDGTFDGLLTVIFDGYHDRKNLQKVTATAEQIDWMTAIIEVLTNEEKARRIEKYICTQISKTFFQDMKITFLSSDERKDTAIVQSTYRGMEVGSRILDSVEDAPLLMAKLRRQVLHERHRYLGLIRFREMEDKILFATIEPKNNILPILLEHFRKRLTNEKFAIFDKTRGQIAYYDGKGFELYAMSNPQVQWSEEEETYAQLWNTFYNAISIKERENKKLRMSNMPKYYWKHLVEEIQ